MRGTLVRIRHPLAVLALLTALNLLNYVDRTVLSAVLAPLIKDLGISSGTAGLLPSIFLIGYFGASPVFGSLGDVASHRGRRRLLAAGIGIWSLATIASGLARNLVALMVARAFVGIGEASYAAVAPTLIDDFAPKEQKARWLSIFYAAIPIGSALGYMVGGAVLHAHGWRAAFFVAGMPGMVAALLCLLIDAPPPSVTADARATKGPFDAALSLLRIPLYRLTVLGYCAYTFALGGFAYWAPVYLHQQYDLEPGHASVIFGLITVGGGLGGTLLGGALGDRATRRWIARRQQEIGAYVASASDESYRATDLAPAPPAAREIDDATARANLVLCALGAGLGAPLAAFALAADTGPGFFRAILPGQVALFLLSGPVSVAVLRSAPPERRTSAMALSTFAIHFLGDLWSPYIIGRVAEMAPMRTAMYAAPAIFALAAIIWWRGSRTSARLA